MTLTLRRQFPAILLVLAIAVQFAPELSVQYRSAGVSALWVAAMIWNYVTAPKIDLGDKPPRIMWDDRDEGEKFTIIMFHLVLLSVGLLLGYTMVSAVNSPEGHWLMIIPAAMIVASCFWLAWTNWKNRNAR